MQLTRAILFLVLASPSVAQYPPAAPGTFETDHLTAIAGLPLLRFSPASAPPEIRVWASSGVGVPDAAFILRQTPTPTGQLIVSWDRRSIGSTWFYRALDSTYDCPTFYEDGTDGVCVPQGPPDMDWRSISDSLERLGLWGMPSEGAYPGNGSVSNAPFTVVELWKDNRYRVFGFQGWKYPPRYADRAKALRELLSAIVVEYQTAARKAHAR